MSKQDIQVNNNDLMSKSAGQLIEVLTAMMDSHNNEDDCLKSRSISLIGALAQPLVYLRDHSQKKLTVDTFTQYLDLEKAEKLAFYQDRDEPSEANFYTNQEDDDDLKAATASLRAFLLSIPGYQEQNIGKTQSVEAQEQFGYVAMTLVRSLDSAA